MNTIHFVVTNRRVRVSPERLFKDALEVRHLLHALWCGRPLAQHSAHLRVKLLLYLGVSRQQMQGERQRVRRLKDERVWSVGDAVRYDTVVHDEGIGLVGGRRQWELTNAYG